MAWHTRNSVHIYGLALPNHCMKGFSSEQSHTPSSPDTRACQTAFAGEANMAVDETMPARIQCVKSQNLNTVNAKSTASALHHF